MNRLDHALEFCNNMEHKPKLACIYIIKCCEYYKVGYASDFKQRYSCYKVHNPLELEIIYVSDNTLNTSKAKAIERNVFKKFYKNV